MILQELCSYYDVLVSDPESGVALRNYSSVGCSYAITLSESGEMKGIIPLAEDKKKLTLVVPEQKTRTSKSMPYFLCDKSKYFLGFEWKKDKEKKSVFISTEKFVQDAYVLHKEITGSSNSKPLNAVLNFLKNRAEGIPLDIDENHPVFQNGFIVFRYEGEYVHNFPEVRALWEKYNTESNADETYGQCLITGEDNQKIARIHTNLKGIAGGQASGCSLVSFNKNSFESYGKSQSYNAPISETAMFKYTTALKHLLSKKENSLRLADTTVLFWAESRKEEEIISYFLNTDSQSGTTVEDTITEQEIADILRSVRDGKPVSGITNPDSKTCILGLSPNMARLSIRFWYQNTFREFVLRMAEHQENMRVLNSKGEGRYVSISQILRRIAPPGKEWWTKVPASYEQALFHAVISGAPYPLSVYTGVLMRIRAEAGDDFCIDPVRTGYLKAVLMRNYHNEELTVTLNQKSTDTAYSLGRMFAVMESLQEKANGTSTIRSRYFAAASMSPKKVFPSLLNLSQHHIAKYKMSGYLDKMMESILSVISEFPAHLSLEEQGKFVLGYYHQREYLYMKKEDKEKLEE